MDVYVHEKIYHCKGFKGHLGAPKIFTKLSYLSTESTIIKAFTFTTAKFLIFHRLIVSWSFSKVKKFEC